MDNPINNLNISPENQMSTEDLHKYDSNTEPNPVIAIDPKKEMPLFISGTSFGIPGTDLGNFHIMVSIIHNVKENTIETKGRLRFEETGNKQMLEPKNKLPYTSENLEKLKKEALDIYSKFVMIAPYPIQMMKLPFKLSFEVGEDVDSIIQKMNDSNEFNIGVIDKKDELQNNKTI